jgi:hypothetical protein
MATRVQPIPQVDVHETNIITPSRRRIAWGAIIAGAIIALIVQLGLNMLGFSIGVNTVNPATEVNPVDRGLGSAAVIWFAASGLIAFFTGGYVAGRMAGFAEPFEGVMHGILAWAVAGIVSLMLLTTSVGNLINTATNAIGQGIALAGQSLSEVSPEVAEALNAQDTSLQSIIEEARASLRQTGATDGAGAEVEPAAPADATGAEVEPTASAEEGEEVGEVVQDTAAAILQQPENAGQELESAISRLLGMGEEITEEDREAVVQVIVNRTELTEPEAREALARWEQNFAEVRANAEETARQAGQAVADSLARIAGAVFAAMVVGAFAAGAGGWVGSPDEEDVVITRTTP